MIASGIIMFYKLEKQNKHKNHGTFLRSPWNGIVVTVRTVQTKDHS